MNRAEREALRAARLRGALGWPAKPPQPVGSAEIQSAGDWFHGWWVNVSTKRVGQGVTNAFLHSTVPYTDEELKNRYGGSRVSLSQRSGGPWYRTRLDALRALHWIIAQEAAEALLSVEYEIEAADAALSHPDALEGEKKNG